MIPQRSRSLEAEPKELIWLKQVGAWGLQRETSARTQVTITSGQRMLQPPSPLKYLLQLVYPTLSAGRSAV